MIVDPIKDVLEKIERAAKRCGRNLNEITLVAVTKTHPLEACLPLIDYNIVNFGENRIPDAFLKMENAPPQVKWHFIGSLQRKKVPKIIGRFTLIHSVDSFELAEKISQASQEVGLKTAILIQVNTSNEESKHGLAPDVLEKEFFKWIQLKGLEIQGLMTMAPLTEDTSLIRKTFSSLRQLQQKLQKHHPLPHLSMGMSHDYEIAIEEGATLLRIGSALWE